MKIVFFGTSPVGLPILETLSLQHEIVLTVTSPDAKVGRKQLLTPSAIAQLAESKNLPVAKPVKVKNNPELLEQLRELAADIFVVVSYGKILPAELLDIPRLKTVNVHFSLLPKYRGPAPIQFALLNGDVSTGTTIFVLDELVDHGPILARQECAIDPHDTFATLSEKLSAVSATLISQTLPQYEAGEIVPTSQNHDEATTTRIITKDDGRINWQEHTAQEIYNQYRAFNPWPQIWTTYRGETFKIISCRPTDNPAPDAAPCQNNTYLQLIEVQPAGKTKMTMADFLNGHPDFSYSDLGS